MRPHITISITEGRTVRDLFYHGLLDHFTQAEVDITILTEAVTVPRFVELWQRENIDFAPFLPAKATRQRTYAYNMRKRLAKAGNQAVLKWWIKQEGKYVSPPPPQLIDFLQRKQVSLVLTTHAQLEQEIEIISAAQKLNIPTLSIARSWDNVIKGLRSRPDHLAVWNQLNYQEAIDLEGYTPDALSIIGAPQFDTYFTDSNLWSRDQLAEHFKLDPNRPIIVFASMGQFAKQTIDETCWMDMLVEMLNRGELENNPQIICRLHPHSHYEHFHQYSDHPDIRLSFVERYWPFLKWYMNREDMVLMANMLHHSDVVITPASTVTLEAAIFDRPTIVVMFHIYEPEKGRTYFKMRQLDRHFKRLAELDLVPILHEPAAFAPAINEALGHPEKYRKQRQQIVKDYVGFTDGQSTKRLADLALKLMKRREAPAAVTIT